MKTKHLSILRFARFLIVLTILYMGFFVPTTLHAETLEVNVLDAEFGANGTDGSPDTDTIQRALDLAWQTGKELVVNIPAGTYHLNKTLCIYSNTTLNLAEDTYILGNGNLMQLIYAAHRNSAGNICGHYVESCDHYGYSQWSNITINGGVWDAKVDENTNRLCAGIRAEHGRDFVLKNATIQNTNIHIVNVAASQNVLVENCKLINNKANDMKYSDTDEALHLDLAGPICEPVEYPYDNTAVKDVIIRGCYFKKVGCGIGSHSTTDIYMGDNILIDNNTFEDVICNAINLYSQKNVIITNNVMFSNRRKKSWCFLYTVFAGATLINNPASNIESFWVKGSLVSEFPIASDNPDMRVKYSVVRYSDSKTGPTKYKDTPAHDEKYKIRKCTFKKKGYRFTGWRAYNPLRKVWKTDATSKTKWFNRANILKNNLHYIKFQPGETVKGLIPYHHYEVRMVAQWEKVIEYKVKIRKTVPYNGDERHPVPKVYANGKRLRKSRYTLTYKNNCDPGTAKVIIKGKGKYKDLKIVKTFKIVGEKKEYDEYKATRK